MSAELNAILYRSLIYTLPHIPGCRQILSIADILMIARRALL